MEELRTYFVMLVGTLLSLLAPIQNFMYAMLILFGINFFFGIVAAIVNKEKWSNKKALMFFVYCAIFLVTACSAFVIGHFLGEQEQAVAVVKVLCFLAVYIFGTNIFRNLTNITPKGTSWFKLFDLCYYVLSVQFLEKLPFVKKWQEERNNTKSEGRTILDKDDN